MHYTEKQAEKVRYELAELYRQFNQRHSDDRGDTHHIEFDPYNPWEIDQQILNKAIYELEYRLTDEGLEQDWQGAPAKGDPSWGFHWATTQRRAVKGLKIAAHKSGLPIPYQFDELAESQYQKMKQKYEQWRR